MIPYTDSKTGQITFKKMSDVAGYTGTVPVLQSSEQVIWRTANGQQITKAMLEKNPKLLLVAKPYLAIGFKVDESKLHKHPLDKVITDKKINKGVTMFKYIPINSSEMSNFDELRAKFNKSYETEQQSTYNPDEQ
jgi:hypothetical protein